MQPADVVTDPCKPCIPQALVLLVLEQKSTLPRHRPRAGGRRVTNLELSRRTGRKASVKATAGWGGGDGACLDLPGRRRRRRRLGAGDGAGCHAGFYRVPQPLGEQAHTFRLKLPNNQEFSPGKLPPAD